MDGVSELIREIKEGQETVFDLIGDNGDSVRRVEISRRQLRRGLKPTNNSVSCGFVTSVWERPRHDRRFL